MRSMIAVAIALWIAPMAARACDCDHHHVSHHAGATSATAPLAPGHLRVSIPVTGMHCDHCASSVHAALARIDGVTSADVYLDEARVVVVYEKGKVDPARLGATIDRLGFKVGAPTQS